MGRTEYDPLRKKAVQKRTRIAALMIFLAIPAVIFFSTVLDGGRYYMIMSVLVIICCMLPFFLVFEKRKPKAREIVLVAMMSAITCAAHMVLHVTVPLQIGTAMIIVAGIAMGPEAGFLVGALSRFVCNFYIGQGPWTPWQMFCWGLLGFLAGLCFNKVDITKRTDQVKSRSFQVIMGPVLSVVFAMLVAYVSYLILPEASDSVGNMLGWRFYAFGVAGLLLGVLLQRKRMPVDHVTITVFTFFATMIIYGGIMNIASMFTTAGMMATGFSWEALRLLYISGLPYDLAHGAAAAFCIFLIGDPMIRKIERIKIKYGIYK